VPAIARAAASTAPTEIARGHIDLIAIDAIQAKAAAE
jgi:hypothetical protein